jgi:hypothetical protein
MGAKTCLLVQAQMDARKVLAGQPTLDEAATVSLVASLFPKLQFGTPSSTDLSHTYPRGKTVVAGCFPGLWVIAADEVAFERPSQLPAKYIAAQGTTYLHAMHSVVDWFGFAVWEDGVLRRSLSVAPDNGVIEDIGNRLPFEIAYWEGEYPAVDPEEEQDSYPLPFHPLDLGEAALREFFGFQLEGFEDTSLLQPESIRMLKFAPDVSKPWWKFW